MMKGRLTGEEKDSSSAAGRPLHPVYPDQSGGHMCVFRAKLHVAALGTPAAFSQDARLHRALMVKSMDRISATSGPRL